jgi:hypothetical protein
MSKNTDAFFEQLRSGEQPTVLESLRESILSVAPGLSLDKIVSDIGAELRHLGAQGSHEVASALFRGDAFVMYPHAGKEAEGHGVHGESQAPQQEQDRGIER